MSFCFVLFCFVLFCFAPGGFYNVVYLSDINQWRDVMRCVKKSVERIMNEYEMKYYRIVLKYFT